MPLQSPASGTDQVSSARLDDCRDHRMVRLRDPVDLGQFGARLLGQNRVGRYGDLFSRAAVPATLSLGAGRRR